MRVQKSTVKRRGPDPGPQWINAHAWYYENARNIDVYISNKDSGAVHARIPWRKLLASLKRRRHET